jgi:hypothetical protein
MVQCKTEEINESDTIDRTITIENREIKRITDFCYSGSAVSENNASVV